MVEIIEDHPVYGPIYERKMLPDGRETGVVPKLFNTQIFVGWPGEGIYEDMW